MKLRQIIHIITLKNATYKQLKNYAIYGAVAGIFGVTATYLLRQYRVKHTDYSLEAFRIFTNTKPLMDMVGHYRTGMVSLSKGVTVITDDFAKMDVFVKGHKANGILHYEATKTDDEWHLSKLEFQFTDLAGGRVRLIKERRAERENVDEPIESDEINITIPNNLDESVDDHVTESAVVL